MTSILRQIRCRAHLAIFARNSPPPTIRFADSKSFESLPRRDRFSSPGMSRSSCCKNLCRIQQWLSINSGKSNLAKASAALWSRLHRLLRKGDACGNAKSESSTKTSRCWSEGLCVCKQSADGLTIWRCRNSLLKAANKEFHQSKPMQRRHPR